MKKHLITWFGVVMAACLLLSLVLTGCGSTAAVSKPAPNPTANNLLVSAPDTIASPAPAKGPQEGIKVHGHWTIEVTNPDGTVAQHTEFENALLAGGASVLTGVLNRGYKFGGWAIILSNTSGSNPFAPSDIGGIFEHDLASPPVWASNTLSLDINSDLHLVLSGTINALHDGEIDKVQTRNYFSVWDINMSRYPSDPYQLVSDSWYVDFTGTNLLHPVTNLKAGQQISVTVTISFSTNPNP